MESNDDLISQFLCALLLNRPGGAKMHLDELKRSNTKVDFADLLARCLYDNVTVGIFLLTEEVDGMKEEASKLYYLCMDVELLNKLIDCGVVPSRIDDVNVAKNISDRCVYGVFKYMLDHRLLAPNVIKEIREMMKKDTRYDPRKSLVEEYYREEV